MRIQHCFKRGLLKKVKPDMANAGRSLKLAESNLEDARVTLSTGRYRVVVVSSYTAMFHAARAVMFRDGIKERSHECVPVYLKAEYPDLKQLANVLDSYRRFRHHAIYGLDFTTGKEAAGAAVRDAEEFLDKIRLLVEN